VNTIWKSERVKELDQLPKRKENNIKEKKRKEKFGFTGILTMALYFSDF